MTTVIKDSDYLTRALLGVRRNVRLTHQPICQLRLSCCPKAPCGQNKSWSCNTTTEPNGANDDSTLTYSICATSIRFVALYHQYCAIQHFHPLDLPLPPEAWLSVTLQHNRWTKHHKRSLSINVDQLRPLHVNFSPLSSVLRYLRLPSPVPLSFPSILTVTTSKHNFMIKHDGWHRHPVFQCMCDPH